MALNEKNQNKQHFECLFDMIDSVHRKNHTIQGPPKNLFDAARQGHCDSLKTELLHNVRKWGRSNQGRSILHEAVLHGHVSFVVMLLDQFEMDIHIRTMLGRETPLHLAVAAGHEAVCVQLLRRGADPNRRNKRGDTPICYAKSESLVSLLELYGGGIKDDKEVHT
jgi:ankyrin repeat protein